MKKKAKAGTRAVKKIVKKKKKTVKAAGKKTRPVLKKAKKARAVRKITAGVAQRVELGRDRAEESKYYPRPTPYLPPRQWEHEELPSKYGDTRIVVMTRDPHWIFAYWEVGDERRMQIEREASASWDNLRKVLRVYDVTGKGFNGSNANRFFDIDINSAAANWYINVGEADRSWCVDLGVITSSGKFILIARSNIVSTPRDSASDVIDEEWMSIEEQFLKLYGLWGGFAGASPGKARIKKIMKERLQQALASGGISSFVRPEKFRGFWMVVNTELIVYGATEPDAAVTVQGRPIKLNRDGSFSLRFALPDGEQVIPVKGVSHDKAEERTITPIVKKYTK
ncbi:MAG: DUF4912 domain-containing protein [Candidatus Omnitrophica bacterium]|nr:DUF4912 domain-containing protein [Candidatus Omnitrophota bacterium]MDD5546825.1 DUF4912 domain-containing protein [Candidatus Omnitrophota bacterium]